MTLHEEWGMSNTTTLPYLSSNKCLTGRLSADTYAMPTASTSARTYSSSYKPVVSSKRVNSMTAHRTSSHLNSNNSIYNANRTTYTPEALNRPLPSTPLTRTIRGLEGKKPISTSNISRVDHAKYSTLKTLYDGSLDYSNKREARICSMGTTIRPHYYSTGNIEAITATTDKSGLTGRRSDISDGYTSRMSRGLGQVNLDSEQRDYYGISITKTLRDNIDDQSGNHSCQEIDNISSNSSIEELGTRNGRASAVNPSRATPGPSNEQHQHGGKVGLKNLGNTCFMNSILQILSNTRVLLEYCLHTRYKADVNKRSSMNGSLMIAYADLIRHLWTDTACVSPNSFKSQIQRFAPRFMGYQQQDAQEFLRYLLEGLHEDVNRITARQKPYTQHSDEDDKMSDSEKAKEYWRRYLRRDDSKIVEVFVGQLRSELKFSCGHTSVTFDPFWDLSVSIPRVSNDVSLTDCVAQFMRDEELDAAETPTCSKCKAKKSCRKGFSIQKFPQILVFHLKRFSQEMFRRKLNTLVDFPVTLDLSKFAADKGCVNTSYSLYGVCNHSGGTHSGHYTAFSRHAYTNQWHCYNDSRVSTARVADITSSEAYVLFYELTPAT